MNYSLIPGQVDGDDPLTGRTYVRLQTDGARRLIAGMPVIAGQEAHGLLWRPKQGDWVLCGYLPGQGLCIIGPYSAPALAVGRSLGAGEMRVTGDLGVGHLTVRGTTTTLPTFSSGTTNSSATTLLSGNDVTGSIQFTGRGVAGLVTTCTLPAPVATNTAILLMPQNATSIALFLYAPDIAAAASTFIVYSTNAGTNGSNYFFRYMLIGVP